MFLISREFGKASAKKAFPSFVSDWCGKSFLTMCERRQVASGWFDGLGLAITIDDHAAIKCCLIAY
jgi:hypothetical protein